MPVNNFVAKAEITINSTIDVVWDALTNPATIKKYMFGTDVVSDWKAGSRIIWKGEWNGKPYEDKGVILQVRPKTRLQYTHFSPLAGQADIPENYHTVTIELIPNGSTTVIALYQDNNHTEQEQQHSAKNWAMMLSSLKKLLEG